jgi:hypothetical protein
VQADSFSRHLERREGLLFTAGWERLTCITDDDELEEQVLMCQVLIWDDSVVKLFDGLQV